MVMMPCVLRRQTMGGDLPLFQFIGFVVRVSGKSAGLASCTILLKDVYRKLLVPRKNIRDVTCAIESSGQILSGFGGYAKVHFLTIGLSSQGCVHVCCDPQVIAIGFTIMVIRYLDAGHLLSSSSRSQRRERLLLAVRTYLRKQWLHFFSWRGLRRTLDRTPTDQCRRSPGCSQEWFLFALLIGQSNLCTQDHFSK